MVENDNGSKQLPGKIYMFLFMRAFDSFASIGVSYFMCEQIWCVRIRVERPSMEMEKSSFIYT